MLIVISGLPGVGKSAVAEAVAAESAAVHLSVDVVENAMLGAGLPTSWEMGVAAYEATRAVAEQNLVLGRTVVVDAVNDSEVARDTWRVASQRCGVELVCILLELDDKDAHHRRLTTRERGFGHLDEPTWRDTQRRAAAYEPWHDCVRIDAAPTLDEVVHRVTELVSTRC